MAVLERERNCCRRSLLSASVPKSQVSLPAGDRRAFSSLRRRIGDQIRIAVVDAWILRPDRRIEAGGQSGLQLRVSEARNSGAILNVPTTLRRIADAAGVEVPIGLRIVHTVGANESTSERGAAYQSYRIG